MYSVWIAEFSVDLIWFQANIHPVEILWEGLCCQQIAVCSAVSTSSFHCLFRPLPASSAILSGDHWGGNGYKLNPNPWFAITGFCSSAQLLNCWKFCGCWRKERFMSTPKFLYLTGIIVVIEFVELMHSSHDSFLIKDWLGKILCATVYLTLSFPLHA